MQYLITECPDHGTKSCSDRASFRMYVACARDCRADIAHESVLHESWHIDDGTDCWECCPLMVIDPYGELD